MAFGVVPGLKGGVGVFAWLLAFPVVGVAQAGEGMTEEGAVRALLDSRLTPERARAASYAYDLGPRAGYELRGAVTAAAWAELRETPLTGSGKSDALADLGAAAFPAVLEFVANPDTRRSGVTDGLVALRFMLEDGSLGEAEVVRARLSGTQDYSIVKAGLHLAVALEDPELRQIVQEIATNGAAAAARVSRYFSDGTISRNYERNVNNVQDHARALLPDPDEVLPRRRPYPRR